MKNLLPIIALIVLIGCKSKSHVDKGSNAAQALTENQKDTIPSTGKLSIHIPTWPQSCLRLYIAITDNKLIRQAHKEGFFEDLVYDNTLKTDSAVYDT